MLGKVKKFKVLTILVLENKNLNNHKSMQGNFHSSAKVIATNSDIHKAFGLMHQSSRTK